MFTPQKGVRKIGKTKLKAMKTNKYNTWLDSEIKNQVNEMPGLIELVKTDENYIRIIADSIAFRTGFRKGFIVERLKEIYLKDK